MMITKSLSAEWTDTYWTENDVGLIQLPEPVQFTQV
jgi:hypothetical protein